ncbi:unnamed protein product [Vicia faba]|uniref:Uncharacterized protein n=1 Tax=Vicia faba TaxID=3906 RepID=A0AAV1B785_VICFA|nr:unnamed protein product [Vicia faba]
MGESFNLVHKLSFTCFSNLVSFLFPAVDRRKSLKDKAIVVAAARKVAASSKGGSQDDGTTLMKPTTKKRKQNNPQPTPIESYPEDPSPENSKASKKKKKSKLFDPVQQKTTNKFRPMKPHAQRVIDVDPKPTNTAPEQVESDKYSPRDEGLKHQIRYSCEH